MKRLIHLPPEFPLDRSAVLAVLVVLILGLSSASDSGIMWDEALHAASPYFNAKLIGENRPLPVDLSRYGTFVDFTSYALFRLYEKASGSADVWHYDASRLMIRGIAEASSIVVNEDFYHFKHRFVFLCSIVGYLSAAAMLGILVGKDCGWLAVVFLFLMPRFWGHSLFNPKDAPFAAMFTFSTLIGGYLVERLVARAADFPVSKARATTVLTVLFAFSVGITTSIRAGGVVLLGFVCGAYLLLRLLSRDLPRWREVGLLLSHGALGFVVWATVVIAFHPASWSHPAKWFWETLYYLSHHVFSGSLLFAGEYLSSQALPWYYMPLWFVLTTPLVVLCLFVIGVVWLMLRAFKLSLLQQSCLVLVMLQVFFLISTAILLGSTLDAGVRQFLFVLPGIAVVSAAACAWLYRWLKCRWSRALLLAAVIGGFLPVARDLWSLHPYQYIYFNELARAVYHAPEAGKPLWKQFDTDYLGLSLREVTEWLNDHGKAHTPVYMNGPFHSVVVFAAPHFSIVHMAHVGQRQVIPPFYYLSLPRGNWDAMFSHCPLGMRAKRQLGSLEIPLSVVKACQ